MLGTVPSPGQYAFITLSLVETNEAQDELHSSYMLDILSI